MSDFHKNLQWSFPRPGRWNWNRGNQHKEEVKKSLVCVLTGPIWEFLDNYVKYDWFKKKEAWVFKTKAQRKKRLGRKGNEKSDWNQIRIVRRIQVNDYILKIDLQE